MKYKYYIFNKPYNVLSQFSKELPQHITLQDFVDVEKDVYPVGRLDKDSEGLLLLTNNNQFKTQLLDPASNSPKSYWVQLEGSINNEARLHLEKGVEIKLKSGIYKTKSCKVSIITSPNIEERDPPIRERKNIPTCWIEITITEGKNRQVRKMCASVGFPCLRLIRCKIKLLDFLDVSSGKFRALNLQEIKTLNSK
ncbi:MAG: 23S rRNA pseudouridine2457 synthase [Saprospiraceae bacterium]|jgi:23S rRNA pseudouridine2457 synthase